MPWLQKLFHRIRPSLYLGGRPLYQRGFSWNRHWKLTFWNLLEKKYPEAVLRLEVEEENGRAVKVYEKNGFNVLPYMEMKKLL